jgi:hypothetical protein
MEILKTTKKSVEQQPLPETADLYLSAEVASAKEGNDEMA